MTIITQVFAVLAALLHVLFFCTESLLFTRPAVYRRFGIRSGDDAAVVRPMMFNQGFYNLFLALGCLGGVLALHTGAVTVGATLVVFTCGCMLVAGLVLLATSRTFVRAAAIQAVPPLVALGAALVR